MSRDAWRAPRARRSARRLPGAVSGGYDSGSFRIATHLLLDADGIDGGGSLRDDGGAAGGFAGASRDAGGERNLAGLSEDSHGFRGVCDNDRAGKPRAANLSQSHPTAASMALGRANGLQAGISRSVFISPLDRAFRLQKFTKRKTERHFCGKRRIWYRRTKALDESSRVETRTQQRGVLRARKRQVRCTRNAAPFRDARRDTPRAQEKAHAREARLGFGFQTFTGDARTRATDARAAPRRNRARGASELLAKPTKSAKMADDAAWDTSKENFQPLRKGREAKILKEVSAMPQGERASKIKEERRYAPAAAQISDSAKPTTTTGTFWPSPRSLATRKFLRRFFFSFPSSLTAAPAPPERQRFLGGARDVRGRRPPGGLGALHQVG